MLLNDFVSIAGERFKAKSWQYENGTAYEFRMNDQDYLGYSQTYIETTYSRYQAFDRFRSIDTLKSLQAAVKVDIKNAI